MKLLINRRAEDDLETIYQYIVLQHGADAAQRFKSRADEAFNSLRLHPGIGPHPAWATRHKHLRFWVISRTNYIIYYEVRSDAVALERVLDGRRNVHRIMERGMENEPPEDK